MMRAVEIDRFGGPEVLAIVDRPVPEPRDDEVVLKVAAAGLNPVDNKIRASGGRFKTAADLPVPMGRDVVGTITALGTRAHDMLSVGQRLFAMVGFDRGSFADHVVVKATEMAAVPDGLTDVEAAAVPLAALTAWQGLVDHGGVKSGRRVLIHGASGGVGHFAVQIAKAHGAFVAAVASGGGIDFVRSLGADQVIDREAQRFEEAVDAIDIVLDLIGGETQARSFDVLAPGGIVVSTLTPPRPPAGSDARGVDFIVEPKGLDLLKIAALIEDGRLRPHVAATYPIERVRDAARHLEAGGVHGKIVLTLDG